MSCVPEKSFQKSLREMTLKLRTSGPGHILEMRGSSKTEDITPFVQGQETDIPNMKKNVVFDPSHPDADADGYVTFPALTF